MLDKPQLSKWKLTQLSNACYDNPSIQGGQYIATPEGYAANMIEKAFEQVDDAADKGTLIHDAIENHINGTSYDNVQLVDIGDESRTLAQMCYIVEQWSKANKVQFMESELRLANKQYGYAGTTDAVIDVAGMKGILDFKTRKFDTTKIKPYDEHPTQIAAYHMAKFGEIADDAIGCNLYISTTTPDLIHAIWYDADTLREEWELFTALLKVWQIRKKFNPTKK
jgi:hypothetical protein